MKTKVVNLYREPYDVYIGRGSIFGNPFVIGNDGTRLEVIKKYRAWFSERLKDDRFHSEVLSLAGKRLGCFCKPKECHGDIIVEYLENQENLYIVNAPYMYAGIIVNNSVITQAAPILRWSIGKKLCTIKEWVKRKGFGIEKA